MTHADPREALARFGVKQADLVSILPAVAGPALGTYFGKMYGGDMGALIGGIGGGVGGQLAREALVKRQESRIPPGAPYALDPTMDGIPAWAVSGAQFLQPAMKSANASHDLKDIIFGDTLGPLYPLGEGIMNHDLRGAGKGMLGQAAGVAGGGLLGYGAGALLNHLAGRKLELGGIPVSTLMSGLGATIGGTKGLQWARGK